MTATAQPDDEPEAPTRPEPAPARKRRGFRFPALEAPGSPRSGRERHEMLLAAPRRRTAPDRPGPGRRRRPRSPAAARFPLLGLKARDPGRARRAALVRRPGRRPGRPEGVGRQAVPLAIDAGPIAKPARPPETGEPGPTAPGRGGRAPSRRPTPNPPAPQGRTGPSRPPGCPPVDGPGPRVQLAGDPGPPTPRPRRPPTPTPSRP